MPETARQTYCRPCAAQRRRDQNGFHDAVRRSRDRDRRLAERDQTGRRAPGPGDFVPERDARTVAGLLGALHDAVETFRFAEGRRISMEEEDHEYLALDKALEHEHLAAAAAADVAADLISDLPRLLPPAFLPRGRAPLTRRSSREGA